jgi:hypothetical protein
MQKIDEIFEGFDGLTIIVDNILIYRRSREENYANFRRAFDKAK